jgi:hypothetical protein
LYYCWLMNSWTCFILSLILYSLQHLCLENILNGFTRPCIMDIKLGYKIYEDTADEAKRNKMIKNARGTTIESLGLRISGMKVRRKSRGMEGHMYRLTLLLWLWNKDIRLYWTALHILS